MPRVRWFARGFLAVLVGTLAFMALPETSRATGTYTATANARLVGVDFTAVPAIAFDQLIDAGASVAQAQIDSLGATEAFASDPYPSNSVVLLPGLIAGVTGGETSPLIPAYPLIAATNETTPTDHKELGTVVLDAESTLGNSRGTVSDGATRAVARTTADDVAVVAHAETSISSLQLTPALALDGVRTVADAKRTESGKIDVSSSFEVAALTILGQRIALTPKSLSLLGTNVPLGLDPSSVLAQLLGALGGKGTTVEFIPAVKTADGITAAGLRITSIVDTPPQIASGLRDVRAGVTVGLASVSVSNRTVGGLGPSTDGFIVPPVEPSVTPPVSSSVPTINSPPATVSASSPVALPAVDARRTSTTHPLAVNISLTSFYVVLVVATGLAVGLINLIRHLGVRSP